MTVPRRVTRRPATRFPARERVQVLVIATRHSLPQRPGIFARWSSRVVRFSAAYRARRMNVDARSARVRDRDSTLASPKVSLHARPYLDAIRSDPVRARGRRRARARARVRRGERSIDPSIAVNPSHGDRPRMRKQRRATPRSAFTSASRDGDIRAFRASFAP